MINDILDIERFTTGRFELKIATKNIQELVIQAVENFTQAAMAKKIKITAITPNISTLVACDPQRIEQVLSNLIGNALKFTPEGGTIVLKVLRQESTLLMSVTDS